jgi:glycosyltransferase involved in cell wall biosynthesis
MDISLITSLYRSEAFLKNYTRHVLDTAARLKQDHGLSLEIVIVANDATDAERSWIRELNAGAHMTGTPAIYPIYVERETVYASWNRGIQASSGRCIGLWNADDIRTAAALAEGYHLIEQGCGLMYFPFTVTRPSRLGLRQELRPALPFDHDTFTKAMRGGSFILFGRDIYDKVGPFDEHFKIGGDFEWSARAVDYDVQFCAGTHNAGTFHLHGGNLSDTGSNLQQVEDNIVHLRRQAWQNLKPADPDLMRSSWEAWGSQGQILPPEIADQLWDAGAADRWLRWQKQERWRKRRLRWSLALRKYPRLVINKTGLRSILARLGIVKAN